MSRDWIAKRKDVYEKLLNAGTLFTFTRPSGDKINPITGRVPDKFDETFESPGIRKAVSAATYEWAHTPAGLTGETTTTSLVQAGDLQLLVAAESYTPQLEDRVSINGETWVIKGISPLAPADVALAYYLVVRKG